MERWCQVYRQSEPLEIGYRFLVLFLCIYPSQSDAPCLRLKGFLPLSPLFSYVPDSQALSRQEHECYDTFLFLCIATVRLSMYITERVLTLSHFLCLYNLYN